MTITLDELIELLIELCKIKELKATAYSSAKAGLWTGLATALGGLFLGKHGLLLGAAIGASSSAVLSNEIKPVWMILRDLFHEIKEELFNKLVNAFQNFEIEDIVAVSTLLLSDESLPSIAIRELSSYLQREMNLKLL